MEEMKQNTNQVKKTKEEWWNIRKREKNEE
jgi:hypothetical protein